MQLFCVGSRIRGAVQVAISTGRQRPLVHVSQSTRTAGNARNIASDNADAVLLNSVHADLNTKDFFCYCDDFVIFLTFTIFGSQSYTMSLATTKCSAVCVIITLVCLVVDSVDRYTGVLGLTLSYDKLLFCHILHCVVCHKRGVIF